MLSSNMCLLGLSSEMEKILFSVYYDRILICKDMKLIKISEIFSMSSSLTEPWKISFISKLVYTIKYPNYPVIEYRRILWNPISNNEKE